MNIKVSIGEIVDKLSILKIKKNNILDVIKLNNITTEYNYLNDIVFNQLKISEEDFFKLVLINEKLWKIEDDIRDMERNKTYDIEFIKLARSVYFTNDVRAEIKKEINLKYNSLFVEEKSYSKY